MRCVINLDVSEVGSGREKQVARRAVAVYFGPSIASAVRARGGRRSKRNRQRDIYIYLFFFLCFFLSQRFCYAGALLLLLRNLNRQKSQGN